MAKKIKTYEEWLEEVKEDGLALENVPEEHRTSEMCYNAVKQIINEAQSVPKKGRNFRGALQKLDFLIDCIIPEEQRISDLGLEDFCIEAVKSNGVDIEFVNIAFRTLEVCKAAVRSYPKAIEYVPDELKEQIKYLVGSDDVGDDVESIIEDNDEEEDDEDNEDDEDEYRGDDIDYFDYDLTDDEINVLYDIENYGDEDFENVPKSFWEKEDFCIFALEKRNEVVEYIPKSFWKNKDFCYRAIKTWVIAFKYVPEAFITEELCIKNLKRPYSAFMLKYVPKKYKTAEVCLMAVENDSDMLQYVPKELREKIAEQAGIDYDPDDYSDDDEDEKSIFDFDDDEDDDEGLDAKGWAKKGLEYYKQNDLDNAIKSLTNATELDPSNARYFNNRAYIYKEMRQLDNAIDDVNTAIELDADNASYWDTRAEVYEAKGDFKKAIEDAKKALELDPDKESAQKTIDRCEEALKKAPTAQPSTDQKACPSCGKQLKSTEKFCGKCGMKLDNVCSNCGKVLKEGAKFCGKCGTKQ